MNLKQIHETIQSHMNGKIPVVVAHKFSEIGKEQEKLNPVVTDLCKLLGNDGTVCTILQQCCTLISSMTSKMIDQDFNYDEVKRKVLFLQHHLSDPEQYQKELDDHIAHNFEKGTISYEEYKERIDSFFAEYAKVHRALPAYNMLQRWCKELGEQIGKQDFQRAKSTIDMIAQNVSDQRKYHQAATSHHVDGSGQLTQV